MHTHRISLTRLWAITGNRVSYIYVLLGAPHTVFFPSFSFTLFSFTMIQPRNDYVIYSVSLTSLKSWKQIKMIMSSLEVIQKNRVQNVKQKASVRKRAARLSLSDRHWELLCYDSLSHQMSTGSIFFSPKSQRQLCNSMHLKLPLLPGSGQSRRNLYLIN